MDDRLATIERRLEAVTRELDDLRTRLESLEGKPPALSASSPDESSSLDDLGESHEQLELAPTRSAGSVFYIGRSLMVLGGAYLLRAGTEAEIVPAIAGAAMGLVYAALWLYFCERAQEAGEHVSAGFHGVISLFIAYPLIWEACTRMNLISPAPGAAVLLCFFVLASAQSWRRDLKEVVWINTGLAVLAAAGLAVITRSILPFTATLVVIAAFTEWFARTPETTTLRALAAFGLDVAAGTLLFLSIREGGMPEGFVGPAIGQTASLVGAFVGVYLTSIAVRTLRLRQTATAFDVAQAAVVVALAVVALIGLGPAGALMRTLAGVLLLGFAAAVYAAAFGIIDRALGRTLNFYIYTSFAALLVLSGTLLALGAAASAVAWCAMAAVALWLGGTFDRITLRFHGAAYLAGAVFASGLFDFAADALLARPATSWRELDLLAAAVSVVASAGYAILARTRKHAFSVIELVPQAVVACVLVWALAGLCARGLALVLAHAPGPNADAAILAAVRTSVLSAAAVALSAAQRRFALRDLGWFVYPVLAVEACRLVLEDVRQGRPGTLFVTFAVYGGALIAVSRLSRKAA